MNLQPGGRVVIYFVQDATSSNKDMRRAFVACQDAKLQPKIISEEDVDDVPQAMNVVFVLEEFRGTVFNNLTSSDSLVVGPRCLFHCVNREIPIPSNESPIFTMAMKGVICTSSHLPKHKKEEIAALVGYMAGSYSDKLTGATTHLISDEGRSPKCDKAVECSIPIMTSKWVMAVWEASKSRDVTAFDPEFTTQYKLPPFKGMHISCSNLSQAVKKKIQAAVEAHGGVYMAALEQNKTTALIIGEPDGKKFQAAQQWGIPCLTPQWIFDSVEKHSALHSKNYLVNARPKCSTPTNDLPSFMSNDVSIIPFAGDSANNTVNETNSTMTSMNSFRCQQTNVAKPQPKPQHEHKKLIEEINLVDAAAAGSFLDGCKVFLSGFSNQEMDKMKKLINRSGATLFPEISDRLSHVIMGEFLPDHVKEIEKLSEKPQVVSVEWILASIRLKTAAPSDPYLCFKPTSSKNTPVPPASPLSHKGLSLLKSNPKSDSPRSSSNDGFSTSRKLFVKANVPKWSDSQDDSLERPGPINGSSRPQQSGVTDVPPAVAQPVPAPLSAPEPRAAPAPDMRSTPASEARTTPSAHAGTPGLPANDGESLSCSSLEVGPFFNGLVFLVIGFDDPTSIIESIFAVGGKVESSNFQGVADYAVIPLNGVSTQLTATEVVTSLWVEDCYEHNKVVPVDYFHQPVPLKPDKTPLKGCVICVSGYLGKERTFIFNLAGALGAKVQDLFSRKDHPEKNIFKSTHLVCKTPSGSKYNAAVKWGIPVVSESWLMACVSTSDVAPVDGHLLKENGNGVQMPKNPAVQRLKETAADASVAVVANTPVRKPDAAVVNETTPGPSRDVTKRVDSAGPKQPDASTSKDPDASASKRADVIAQPLEVQSRKRPASPSGEFPAAGDQNETVPGDPGSKITPRNSLNNATVDFVTPANYKRLSAIGSAGKSPFHQDTPTSPYGRVFLDKGAEPSPDTRKKWKRFIDNLPDLYEGSPEVQEFRKRRPSTPLAVVLKQCMVKFGGAEIEGIHPETGDLLPNGPFAEWADEKSSGDAQPEDAGNANKENPDALSKELSNLKSRLSSVLTPSQQKAAENDLEQPGVANHSEREETFNTKAGSWITPKGIDKPSAPPELQWDFGKPTVSVNRQPEPVAKKLRMSNEEEDNAISEQVSKLYEKEKTVAPKQQKRIFVLSQIPPGARERFEGIIRSLGGEMSTATAYDPRCTHLVVDKVLRSEKLLCSVASGKWVVHSSYLTQCYQSRTFLPEEDYEWGNERSRTRLPSLEPGTIEWHLARAVHKWRVRRTDLGQPDSFRSFKAVVVTSENKMAAYVRLLQAGNATILSNERILEATHVFWDEDKAPLPVDRSLLKSHKIPLLKPVYLSDYLAKSPPPKLEEYMIR